MPAISIIFTTPVFCASCGAEMAVAGAYSQLCNKDGAVILFNEKRPPVSFVIELECKNDHRSLAPHDIALQWSFLTDRNRADGPRAIVRSWVAAKPRALIRLYLFMAKMRPFAVVLWVLMMSAIFGHEMFHDSKPYYIGLAGIVVLTLLLMAVPWATLYADAVRTGIKTPD